MRRGVMLFAVAIALAAVRCDGGPGRRFDAARDSVTVRAYIKPWGFHQTLRDLGAFDVEWRPDSQTVRTCLGDTFKVPATPVHLLGGSKFVVLHVLSPDSIWVRTPDLQRAGHTWTALDQPVLDSVLVTREVRWWITPSTDAGSFVGLRMAPGENSRRLDTRGPTYRIVGRVVDARSGEPCRTPWPGSFTPTAMVRVAWGSSSADADSLGYFGLEGLREGWVKLNVSSYEYSATSRLVHVPAESLIVGLLPGSPVSFEEWFEEPTAIKVPVAIPGPRPTPPRRAPTRVRP